MPQNYKTKLCKQYHEHLYCPYGVRCQFLHDDPKPKKQKEVNYSDKLKENIELFKIKIEAKVETKKILKSQKKLKDNLDGVFGKGKRLPVFSVITVNNENVIKPVQCKKNKKKKTHKFAK